MTAHLEKLKWSGGTWFFHYVAVTDDGTFCGRLISPYLDGQGPLRVRFRLPEPAE